MFKFIAMIGAYVGYKCVQQHMNNQGINKVIGEVRSQYLQKQ